MFLTAGTAATGVAGGANDPISSCATRRGRTVYEDRRIVRRRYRMMGGVAAALFLSALLLMVLMWPSRDPMHLLIEDSAQFVRDARLLDEPLPGATWSMSAPVSDGDLLAGQLWGERLLVTDIERLHARFQYETAPNVPAATASVCIAPMLYGRNFRWLTVGIGRHLVNPQLVSWEVWRAAQPSGWRTTLAGLADDAPRRATKMARVPVSFRMFDTHAARYVVSRDLHSHVWVRYVDPMATLREGRLIQQVTEFEGTDAHCIQIMIRWMSGEAPVSYDDWAAASGVA